MLFKLSNKILITSPYENVCNDYAKSKKISNIYIMYIYVYFLEISVSNIIKKKLLSVNKKQSNCKQKFLHII